MLQKGCVCREGWPRNPEKIKKLRENKGWRTRVGKGVMRSR